ncbi:hypothetical protein [Agarivorans sp. QJM3NY_25]|uniref:hypothetical protein n=1 Tax=Agarivorans sp. QJM3NY_25 TaxID=3421430 RepID=UPI003D7EBB81
MKHLIIGFLLVLLQACASTDAEQTNTQQRNSGLELSTGQMAEPAPRTAKPVELYSEQFFLNFESALNQQTEDALSSKIDYDKMIEYFIGTKDLNASAKENLNRLFSTVSEGMITGMKQTPDMEWMYIGSQTGNNGSFISYYRAAHHDLLAYYQFTWLNGVIVDVVNLALGAGISSGFDFIQESSRTNVYSHKQLDNLGLFFKYLEDSRYNQMLRTYNLMPKRFQQQDSILGVLLRVRDSVPNRELPVALSRSLARHKTIHPRYFLYYYEQKKYELALACLAAYPEPVVKDVRIQVEMASLQDALGESQLAETMLVDSILKQPYQPDAYLALLHLSMKTQQNEQAELLLKVLYDRFSVAYSKQSLLELEAGNSFITTANYQRYAKYIN